MITAKEIHQRAGEFPKQCACCGRTYDEQMFRTLPFPMSGGYMGMKRRGEHWTLELRDCECMNTLGHLVVHQ